MPSNGHIFKPKGKQYDLLMDTYSNPKANSKSPKNKMCRSSHITTIGQIVLTISKLSVKSLTVVNISPYFCS